MSEMFKNYPQPEDYVPNNRPKCFFPFNLDIMAGETAKHSFQIPFNVEKDCKYLEIIYKVGLEVVLIKPYDELSVIITECDDSIVSCSLSPEETLLFKNTLLDTQVQIKFVILDDSIVYSDIYPIKVIDSLEAVNL